MIQQTTHYPFIGGGSRTRFYLDSRKLKKWNILAGSKAGKTGIIFFCSWTRFSFSEDRQVANVKIRQYAKITTVEKKEVSPTQIYI
jgi:hypothetical protein